VLCSWCRHEQTLEPHFNTAVRSTVGAPILLAESERKLHVSESECCSLSPVSGERRAGRSW
jgi:hypothetical protein